MKRIDSIIAQRDGIALASVMIIMAIAFVLTISLGIMLISEISSSKRTASVVQAYFAAEGG